MDNSFVYPSLCYYIERNSWDTLMTDFGEFMEEEWKKRKEMVATLQDLKSKVRLNRIQCTHIIDIYSTLEVLTSHPENYLDTVNDDDLDDELDNELEDVSREPVTFPINRDDELEDVSRELVTFPSNRDSSALQRKKELSEGDIKLDLFKCISDLRALFLELNKIMCHGEILVRGCTCEDWIGGAVTQMTTNPKNGWSIDTPFFHHLQQLEWILNAIGRGIEEFWTIEIGDASNLEKHFKVFSILPPNPEVDVGQDRQMLLDDLLEYLSMAPSSEDEKGSEERLQLARFLVGRMQDGSLLQYSNESSDVATCEDARIGRNKMTLIEVLGRGGCSLAVYSKKWLGIMVAVKVLEIEALFAKEVEFAGLQHPNIVQVLDHWIGERPNIVMELMDRDLYSFMEKHFKGTSPPLSWAVNVMHQLAEALKYLEDNNVIHRDLKCLNVLVRRCPCENDRCIIVKLADFGGSKFSPTGRAELKTIAGTPGWMAPEVYEDGRVGDLGYTTATDVFSFAITCSEILTGKLPVTSQGLQLSKKDIKAGLRPALPPSCPHLLSAYLRRCWAQNPEERPQRFSEICNFLLVLKEKSLRDGQTIDDDDVKVLLTHFGLKWCLASNVKWGKYSTGPGSTVYSRIMSAIHDGTWELLQNLTGSEVLEAADFFGNWSSDQHSYKKATDILQRWEESPSSNAEITWRLGYCYELGLGVSKDISKAISLYEKACSQNPEVDASAWVELGRCYAMGRGVEKPDLQRASTCWESAGKCEDKLPKSIDEQLKILSSALYDSSRTLAKQRLCELTATKSGQNLFKAFGRQPNEFKSTGHKDTIWEIAKQSTGMWGLIAASAAGVFTSYNEEGKIRFYATCGRLLLLSFLVSRMGLQTLLAFRPTFSLPGLKDFMLVTSYLIAFSAVVHSKVLEFFETLRATLLPPSFSRDVELLLTTNCRDVELLLTTNCRELRSDDRSFQKPL